MNEPVPDGLEGARFLREDLRVEPLINGFRAWPHLLPPHTLARNVASKHLPVLRRKLEVLGEGDTRVRYGYERLRDRYQVGHPRLVRMAEFRSLL